MSGVVICPAFFPRRVMCDGCKEEVKSEAYQCCDCRDFDLCIGCVTAGHRCPGLQYHQWMRRKYDRDQAKWTITEVRLRLIDRDTIGSAESLCPMVSLEDLYPTIFQPPVR